MCRKHPQLPVAGQTLTGHGGNVSSLRQLASLTRTDYDYLRKLVSRKVPDAYQTFRIKKKSGGYRIIAVPEENLLRVQTWIYQQILANAAPSPVSYAYQRGRAIKDSASVHCGCQWLIKLDLTNFFGAISEIDVYRVFRRLNYAPLIAFEMARICTRLGSQTAFRRRKRWLVDRDYDAITAYRCRRMGHLPQGAPTSPALSNLAMVDFDRKVMQLAAAQQLTYSRYADDLCFSQQQGRFSRPEASAFIHNLYKVMRNFGHAANMAKTSIIPPGARKIVLGLLVDQPQPNLQKPLRNLIRQHFYYLNKVGVGPDKHAKQRGFTSTTGLKNYLEGLLAYINDVAPDLAEKYRGEMSKVRWLADA